MGCSGFAQKFTEEDAKQFYRTMQGDYTVIVNDSTTAMAHFTPIWENMGNRFQWLYLEVVMDKKVILQKVLELKPKDNKLFRVYVHDLKNPAEFVGKWGNRNYFDGFTTSILKSGKRITFVKTSDFSYQSHKLMRFGAIDCFPQAGTEGDESYPRLRRVEGTDRRPCWINKKRHLPFFSFHLEHPSCSAAEVAVL